MDAYVKRIVREAKEVSYKLINLNEDVKNKVLLTMADALLAQKDVILRENARDLTEAKKNGLNESFIDRLKLNSIRVQEMSDSLRAISALPDPINCVISGWQRPNGITIQKIRVPIGVVLVIYEARPNVTSDCIGLLFKSSNVAIVRGGKDALHSNRAIGNVLMAAAQRGGVDFAPFFVIDHPAHEIIDRFLKEDAYIDLVIPRGGEALIRKVVEHSRIPVIKHYKGVCHIYVDSYADLKKALTICVNAKVQRPSVCNAVEKIIVHKKCARIFLPRLQTELNKYKVEIRGDEATRAIILGVKKASAKDWVTEYNDLIVTIKVVDDINEAIEHINRYGSHHTDAILTKDVNNARKFVHNIDSACCFVNMSTRFSDGYQFGLGAEIGISTDKLHARGPMGLEDLTTYKYIAFGDGHIRT